ncbi:hypothetical protein EON67_04635, partial [archaeon]
MHSRTPSHVLQPSSYTVPHRTDVHEFSWTDVPSIQDHCDMPMDSQPVIVEVVQPLPTRQGVFPLTKQWKNFAEMYV